MQTYQHPLNFNIAITDYMYFPETKTIKGSVEWIYKNEDEQQDIPKKLIYLVADDSCQFNKVILPNGIGVTAYLEINFLNPILVKNVEVEVKIIEVTKSGSGKNKTLIHGKIYDNNTIYAKYECLFIESPLIKMTNFQLGNNDNTPYKITRYGFLPEKEVNEKNINDMLEVCSDNVIKWNNGYGPFNHVHGGVISFPVFDKLKDYNIKKIRINYSKAIPLGTESVIDITENKFTIKHDNIIQAYGTYY